MFAKTLFVAGGRRNVPKRLHLLAPVHLFHQGIMENVLAFWVFRRPYYGLCGVRKISAGKVRRRIDFVPRNIIEDFVAQRLQGVTDGVDVVTGAANP